MWIYAALLMSVGPVGPGGGVYSIVEVVVYKVYSKKNQIWEPNNHGYIQLCLCLWALSGPEVGYIQLKRLLCPTIRFTCQLFKN